MRKSVEAESNSDQVGCVRRPWALEAAGGSVDKCRVIEGFIYVRMAGDSTYRQQCRSSTTLHNDRYGMR